MISHYQLYARKLFGPVCAQLVSKAKIEIRLGFKAATKNSKEKNELL